MLQTEFIPALGEGSQALLIALHGLGDSTAGYRWLPQGLRLPWMNYLLVNAPDRYYDGYSWYDHERDADPGVSAKAVRIGTVLPTRGRLAPLGEAVRGVLTGAFDALGDAGGLHGRRVVLEVAEYEPDRESGLAAAERLLA